MNGEDDEVTCFYFDHNHSLIKEKKLSITYAEIKSIKSNGADAVISFKSVHNLKDNSESEHEQEDYSEDDLDKDFKYHKIVLIKEL